jgi:hypothetical protein
MSRLKFGSSLDLPQMDPTDHWNGNHDHSPQERLEFPRHWILRSVELWIAILGMIVILAAIMSAKHSASQVSRMTKLESRLDGSALDRHELHGELKKIQNELNH